jgi:hypothetical protein
VELPLFTCQQQFVVSYTACIPGGPCHRGTEAAAAADHRCVCGTQSRTTFRWNCWCLGVRACSTVSIIPRQGSHQCTHDHHDAPRSSSLSELGRSYEEARFHWSNTCAAPSQSTTHNNNTTRYTLKLFNIHAGGNECSCIAKCLW